MKKVLGMALAAVTMTTSAMAEGLQLGTPSYGGNGCPAGSASVSLSPDSSAVSILFDQYSVEAGGTTGKVIDRKSCNIAIPVHVPQGYSVSIFEVDYRGFNALPHGARSQFNVEYFFAGSAGPRFRKDFAGSLTDNYLLSNTLMAEAVVWSRCGEDVTLRTNSNIFVQTNPAKQQAMSTVDSADIRSGIVYHVRWKQCH